MPNAEGHSPDVVTVRILRSHSEIETFRADWESLVGNRDTDIDFYQGLVACAAETSPFAVVLLRAGRVEAVLVGRIRRSRMDLKLGYLRVWNPAVRILSVNQGAIRGNGSRENCRALVQALLTSLRDNLADAVCFDYIGSETFIFEAARQLPRILSRDYFPKMRVHRRLQLSARPGEFYPHVSSAQRSQLRRKVRKLFSFFGDRAAIRCFQDIKEYEELVDTLEEVAAKTYQRGLGVGFCKTAEALNYIRFQMGFGWLRAYLLYIDNRPCAFWVGCQYQDTFLSEYLAFDPEYQEYSPGTVILAKAIEDLAQSGTREVDFGVGDAEYKKRLGNYSSEDAEMRIFAPSVLGLGLNVLVTFTNVFNVLSTTILDKTGILKQVKTIWRSRLSGSVRGSPSADQVV